MQFLTHTVFSIVEYTMMGSDTLILPGHSYAIIIKSSMLQKQRNFYMEYSGWHMEHFLRKHVE